MSVLAEQSSACPPPAAILVQPVKKKRGRPPGSKNNQKTSEDLKMPFGYIYVNNKAVVYGRFVKQITEFKEKTGVDEIRLTEDEKKWKDDFLTCGAFGKTDSVVAALDLMKNEAGCRNSIVG